ncbi:MAG: DUF4097 family beta strand repeat-containing protein [Sphaerochaetaceae bacterium]
MKIRNNKIFITLLLVVVLLAWYFSQASKNPFEVFKGEEKGTIYYSDNLDVKLYIVEGDVNFYIKDGISEVEYSLSGSKREKLVVDENDGSLEISVKSPNFNWFGFDSGSLSITIPSSFIFDRLKVNSVSGDIILDELKAKDYLSFSSISGNVFFNDLSANEIELSTISSNIDGSTASCNILNLRSTSGDIDLAKVKSLQENVLELNAKSISGNLDILDIGSFKSCNLSTTSGNITCYFSVPVGLITQSTSGNLYINGKIQNIEINKINTEAPYLVSASTTSGNISINY